ncbi:hypothetical protein KDK_37910 [Dictyobacter kobayashii]|uniref:Uncharacterized protein n=1 Tax=Dictyobacter kobayashii TaxID=2014872 RepID=A0A402ALH8_9CHLR|nr:hypothetical protein KDK_37910 [Dictyobacter kobayashii]
MVHLHTQVPPAPGSPAALDCLSDPGVPEVLTALGVPYCLLDHAALDSPSALVVPYCLLDRAAPDSLSAPGVPEVLEALAVL